MSGRKEDLDSVSWLPLMLIFGLIVLAWVFTIPIAQWVTGLSDYSKLGPFGDVFGTLNALFSGLAFAGLFYTITLQRQELSLQRKELRDTREVLASQKAEAEKQNYTLRQQSFDSTFFQLLRLHNDIVQAIDVKNGQSLLKGRDCFRKFYRRMFDYYNVKSIGLPADSEEDLLKRIDEFYSPFYLENENDLGHYFRSVYNLIKFVDRSNVDEETKRFYTNLVRAQLSSHELKVLFYNCLSSMGRKKFKPLVEKYSLLKHFDIESCFHGVADKELYSLSAFN